MDILPFSLVRKRMRDHIQQPNDDQLPLPKPESDAGDMPRGGPQKAVRSPKLEERTGYYQPDFDQRLYSPQKLAAVVSTLAEDGVPASEVLAGSDLTPADFISATARISYRQMIAVYNNAIRLSKDPALGFRVGRRMHLTSYGMYGYAMLSCKNIGETAELSAKYARAIGPGFLLTFTADENWARWVFLPVISQDPSSDLYRFTWELSLAMFFNVSKDLFDEPPKPSSLHIVYPPPPHAAAYRDIVPWGPCPVLFNAAFNEVRYPATILTQPIAWANPFNLDLAREACEDILKEIEISGGLAAQVRRALLRVPSHFPPAERIAAELGVSSRQLHRNLQVENTSYRKILDEARKGLAIAYLHKTHLTIEDIATRLGFSDSANFRHAFRRWTGKNTSNFRAK
jgi:AraC-like DNA-binding protein